MPRIVSFYPQDNLNNDLTIKRIDRCEVVNLIVNRIDRCYLVTSQSRFLNFDISPRRSSL